MSSFIPTTDNKMYNNITKSLSGVSLGRYWVSIVYSVIMLILALVINEKSKAVVYSYYYSYNPNASTIETLGIIAAVVSIIYLLAYLILLIIYITRLYDFQRQIPGDHVNRLGSGIQQIGLTTQEGGYLDDVGHLSHCLGLFGQMNVSNYPDTKFSLSLL